MTEEKSKVRRLLHGLKVHGSLDSVSAAKIAGYTRRTAGTTLWRMTRIWPDHFDIDKTERPQVFRVNSDFRRKSVDKLHEEYRGWCRSQYKPKSKPSSAPSGEPPPSSEKETIEVDFNVGDEMFKALAQAAADLLRPQVMSLYEPTEQTKDLNLNVNVTISFKLGG